MRIVIDISDGPQAVRLEPGGVEGATEADGAGVADGGAGPTLATTGNGGREDLPASDAGPPPDWLIDTVGAAQAAGLQLPLAPAADLDGTLVDDAGAGPVADPLPYDT